MKRGVRILAGELRGRRLAVPPSARPTASRVRESLFDVWGESVRGARFLELFAGSGAVALEAVSRGAAEAVLVESDRSAIERLRRTCGELAPDRARVVAARLPGQMGRLGRHIGTGFDLVFADPPYDFTRWRDLAEALEGLLTSGAQVVLEHSPRSDPGDVCGRLSRTSRRPYGDHVLSFYALGRATEIGAASRDRLHG